MKASERDLLLTTDITGYSLMLAIAIHGFLILAFQIASEDRQIASIEQALQVTIVMDNRPPEKAKNARFLSDKERLGSGNTEKVIKPTVKEAMHAPIDLKTDEKNISEINLPDQPQIDSQKENEPALSVKAPSDFLVQEDPKKEEKQPVAKPSEILTNLKQEILRLEAELANKTRAYAERPRRDYIIASTMKHVYADYMHQWQQKIEHIGTENFPPGAQGDVIVLVSVYSDGSLEKVKLKQKSNSSIANEAVLKIVRLASPFPPFSPEIKQQTDILDIIRTWRFISGSQLIVE